MGEMRVGDPESSVYVNDSSLDDDDDHKSNIPNSSSTTITVWRAAILIIVTEFCERMCYFGIVSSLIIYLTKIMQQDLATAAKNVNYWSGATALMPLLGGFIADSYLGGYSTVLLSTIIYLFGMSLLTLSWFVPTLKPCDHGHICPKPRLTHQVLFFIAIYLICIGSGGHKPALQSFGADQFDQNNHEDRRRKMSFFNWWNFAVSSGLLFGVTLIVYVQDHVSFGAADIVLTAVTAIFLVTFVSGTSLYKYEVPVGSPLTPMVRVIVAAIAKRKLALPVDPLELHQVHAHGRFNLSHTDNFKLLDKAAIIESPLKKKHNPWRLATVTDVEEVKLIINMVPVWLLSLVPGIVLAQESTFFIKQATVLDRNILDGFSIPPATIYSLSAVGMMVSVLLYEKVLVPILRRATGNERGIEVLQRTGSGMAVSIISMVVAAIVERKRLNVVRKDSDYKGSLPMSVFWLAPQFLLSGFGNGFTLVGLQEYFYSHVPGSMRSLGLGLYLSAFGTGIFLSSLLINVINHLTGNQTGHRWIGKDLNGSRLDNFYWVLAGMAAVNLCLFVFFAKKLRKSEAVARPGDCDEREDKI